MNQTKERQQYWNTPARKERDKEGGGGLISPLPPEIGRPYVGTNKGALPRKYDKRLATSIFSLFNWQVLSIPTQAQSARNQKGKNELPGSRNESARAARDLVTFCML